VPQYKGGIVHVKTKKLSNERNKTKNEEKYKYLFSRDMATITG
jgi:hypothetical protein